MATDTAPPAPGGSPDPPASPTPGTASAPAGGTGIMAALMAAVEPARPVSTAGASARPDGDDPAAKADPDSVVDRSSPGVTSDSFKAPETLAGADSDAAGTRYKEGVVKTLIRAGATRWAKGGGTTNKRLDLAKARAGAHQVKEARTTTAMKSPGLLTRNGPGGSSGASRNSGGTSGNSGQTSAGNGSTGAGRGGNGGSSGGGRGPSGSNGAGGSSGGHGTSGKGAGGSQPKNAGSKATDSGSSGKSGSSGTAGANGKDGKAGKAGAPGNGGGSAAGGSPGGGSGDAMHRAGKDKGAKDGPDRSGGLSGNTGSNGGTGSVGKSGASGKNGAAGHGAGGAGGGDNRSPLQRTRETGHSDGSAVRNAVDHVMAYAKGAKDGYQDTRKENGEEHARLDKAHDQHRARRQAPKKDDPEQQGTTVTRPGGRTVVIAPPDEGDDGVSTDVKPLLVKTIDTNTLTLGTQGARDSISRKELRNFKQYERKLEAKVDHLVKVADACKSLVSAAEDEAKSCQELAEQAKAVEGGEKLAAKLTQLADHAKAQAAEATELHKRATRAAEMCKVVLTNIATRYAPLYKAVVDSDETKPAELRFYSDKGSYAPAA